MVQEGKAYIHAALALYYAGAQITEDNLKKVVEALGIQVDEAKVKMLGSLSVPAEPRRGAQGCRFCSGRACCSPCLSAFRSAGCAGG